MTDHASRAVRPVKILASAPAERERIANALARLPLAFEPNRGQAAAGVKFLTRAPGYLSKHAPRPQVNAGRPPRLARN